MTRVLLMTMYNYRLVVCISIKYKCLVKKSDHIRFTNLAKKQTINFSLIFNTLSPHPLLIVQDKINHIVVGS